MATKKTAKPRRARIVHTSDWHAGKTWKNVDRLGELEAALDHLARFVEEEKVDLLLHTGDVFDTGAPVAAAERVVFKFLRRIGDAGTRSVVIAGNHDSAARLDAWGTLAELVHVHVLGRPRGPDAGGVREIAVADGPTIVVAAVPFAPVRMLMTAIEAADDETLVRQRYDDGMRRIVAALTARFRGDTVNLLMAHAHVQGAKLSGSEREVHLGEQWATTAQALPPNAHYVALGHIHKPQDVAGPSPARYAGSPLQLDFGEVGETKSFVVVDAEPGLPASVRTVPYEGAKPLLDVRATYAELERDAERLRGSGHLRVRVPLIAADPDANSKVRRLLPNAVSVDVELPEVAPAGEAQPSRAGLSPLDLYRMYCRKTYGADPEPPVAEAFEALRMAQE